MNRLTLGPDLGIESVDMLKTTLMPLVAANDDVVLDAAGVDRIHSAALQTLCAFALERRAAGRPLRYDGVAPDFAEAARLLALGEPLGLDAGESP
jgi:anti-anti-sigma regulatory factor